MELRDYWHSLGRQRLALIVAPLVAAVVALGVGLTQPPSYKSVSTIQVPVANTDGPIEVRQQIANFVALVSSNALAAAVSDQTGVAAGRISQGLEVAQVGNGNVVEVSFTSADKRQAGKVTSSAGSDSVHRYLQPNTAGAQGEVRVAKTQLTTAQQQAKVATQTLNNYTARAGALTPQTTYLQALQSYNTLRNEHENAVAQHFTLTAANLQVAIDVAKRRLGPLAKAAQAYTTHLSALNIDRQQAEAVLISAKLSLVRARANTAGVLSAKGINTTVTHLTSRTSALEQLVAAAVLLGLLVVALWLGLSEYLRVRSGGGRRARPGHVSTSVPVSLPPTS